MAEERKRGTIERAVGRVVMLENTQLNYDLTRALRTAKGKATRRPVVSFKVNLDIKRGICGKL